MPDQVVSFTIAAPVIVGVVSALKLAGLPDRYSPLTAILLGVVASALVFPAGTVGLTIFWGVVSGLTAAGLYSGTKATIAD